MNFERRSTGTAQQGRRISSAGAQAKHSRAGAGSDAQQAGFTSRTTGFFRILAESDTWDSIHRFRKSSLTSFQLSIQAAAHGRVGGWVRDEPAGQCTQMQFGGTRQAARWGNTRPQPAMECRRGRSGHGRPRTVEGRKIDGRRGVVGNEVLALVGSPVRGVLSDHAWVGRVGLVAIEPILHIEQRMGRVRGRARRG